VKLAFGSNWTVALFKPPLGLNAAVTRATPEGKNPEVWFPEQKICLLEAMEAFITGSPYAEFRETKKGSLTPGKLADIVILNSGFCSIHAEMLKDASVRYTITAGKIVFAVRPD
jgi:predicted amidohydrolase YtcJ